MADLHKIQNTKYKTNIFFISLCEKLYIFLKMIIWPGEPISERILLIRIGL